jgi:Flp pilus assembly CpaF family ATPase
VVHPLAVGGPFLTSKFAKEKLQVDDLIRYGTLSATQPASFRPAWSAD